MALLVGLQVIYWAAHATVKSTNFAGIDEWPVIDLASKGIVAFPYANRMLSLLWVLPAHWITPNHLDGFRVLSGLYVSLTGLVLFWVCRRLAPGNTRLAFLAGAFAMLWAPTDRMRISTVQGTVHLGFAFGATLAIALLVESWTRRSRAVLVAAGIVSLATILSYEAVLPLLLLAPLLLPLRDRKARIWGAVWSAFVVAGAAIALSPGPGHSHDYQAGLGADTRPALIAVRIAMLFWSHLGPLLFFGFPAPGANAVIPVLIVVAVAAMSGRGDEREGAGPRRLLIAGLVGATLAYAPYALTPGVVGSTRTQIVSAPWIGLFLASIIELVARRCGPARHWVAAAMGAWIVFLGASHVTSQQMVWDRSGMFPAHRSALLQLFATVPDVKPHTLIVLVGDTRPWPMSWAFRHAMGYFYEGRAAGLVAGAKQEPYPATFGPEGIAITPWPQIREAWNQPETVYRYDEVIVAVLSSSGSLEVSLRWPEGGALPALPPQAVYEPSARIFRRDPRIAAREILNR